MCAYECFSIQSTTAITAWTRCGAALSLSTKTLDTEVFFKAVHGGGRRGIMKCREYGEPDTEREVVVESDDDFAADFYVHEYGDLKAGEVVFVEVLLDHRDSWQLWRVECVLDNQGYLTMPCTKEDMLAEIKGASEIPAEPG